MYLHSINAYADEIFESLDRESIDSLILLPANELPLLHSSWGRAIRNECGFWDPEHPLTTKWHKFPEQRKIIAGCDASEDHPDHVSMRIIEKVYAKVTANSPLKG